MCMQDHENKPLPVMNKVFMFEGIAWTSSYARNYTHATELANMAESAEEVCKGPFITSAPGSNHCVLVFHAV